MWRALPEDEAVLREVTDFGLGKLATVSTCLGGNRYLVLSEQITHTDPAAVDWSRMIGEMYATGDLVEAQ